MRNNTYLFKVDPDFAFDCLSQKVILKSWTKLIIVYWQYLIHP